MDSKQPFFSICIPNYNYAHYIGETIQSVLSQTFQDFEIVIQDNASTDNSWEVIQDFANKDSRIRIFKNNWNVGFAPNLQKVTANSRGKYIILLSSDDIMYPSALEVYYGIILKHEGQDIIICSDSAMIDEHSSKFGLLTIDSKEWKLKQIKQLKHDQINEESVFIYGHDFLGNFVSNNSVFKAVGVFCATCYPRQLWEQVEGYDTTTLFSPDTNFMVKMFMCNPKYIWINNCLFGYRVHTGNNYGTLNKSYNLKNITDKYIRTLNYGENELSLLKLSKIELQTLFVKISCLQQSFQSWIRGNWTKSVQLYAFSLATYPRIALKEPLFYVLTFLNTIGIFMIPIMKIIYSNLTKKS